ncbi:MAG: hypothetical protein A2665_01155 [Candidatus Zambryskibacteria bacterium RIFCSPHIGHO2_01_FULL_46_30]|uniref:HTH arsR-type domain-containing protein n=1 Tax=Candidatus Zambryskibacteria bacterium RIFCSPHIGHO2_01_FULL_46_30 TaxID=1802739 RepID=A0A1G2SYU9_9BACT|nr:MAG: hypothetical protein A2665_01155 [Candidatus Zambryskibacteria bacterium RIFCSPHIGHO2_01_FULL_46_30]OHB05596.1 MAG: hypothetical protein A3B22_02390 [Candidatus Zambryskibacteria bacterium RIFCSPLOWO2_01_FULL_47_33]
MKEKEKERILKALANRRRLAIIELLRKGDEKSVGEIADNIKLSFRATSKHLSVLMHVDILEKEQRSLQMFYSLNKNAPGMVKQLLRTLFLV